MQCNGMKGLYAQLTGEDLYICLGVAVFMASMLE